MIASHEKSINKHTKEISALTISHKKELLSLQDSLIKSSLRIKKLSNEKDHLIHLVQYFGEKAKKSNILTGSDKRIYKRFLKSHSAAIGTTIKKDCPVDKNEENLLNLNEPLSCISEDTGRGSSICTSDDEKYISNNATPERQQSPIYEDLPHLDAEVFTQTKKVDNTCNSLMEEDNCSDSKIEKILNNVRSNLPKIVSPIPSSAPIESVNTTSLNTSKSFQNVTLFTEYFSNIARQIFKEEMIKFSKNSKSMEEELESMVSENVQNPQNIQPQLTIQENCSNFTDSTNILKKIVNYASHMVEIEKSLTYPNGPISPTTNVDKIQEQSVVTKDQFTPDTVSQMDVCEDNINESALIINEFEIEHLQKEDPNFMSTTNCEIVLKSNPEPKVDETSSNISLDDIDSQKIKFLSLNNSKKFKRSEKFHELFNDDEEFSNPKISEVIIESPKTQSNLIRKSPRLHHKAVDTNISENILTDHSKFAVIAPLNSKSSVKTSNRVSTRKKTDLRPIRKSTRNAILSRTIVDSTKDCSYIAKRKSDSESQNIPSKIPKNKDSIINEPTNEEKLNRAKLIMSKLEEKKVPEKTTFLRKKIVQKQKQEISEPKITVDESIFESSTTKNDEEENDLPKNENHEREIVTYEDVLNCNSDTSICFLERLYMKYENQLSVKIKQHKSQNSLDPDIVEALEENLIDYFTSETLDNLYKILSNKKEKKIAAAMVNYLEKQRTENLGEVFLNSTPGISAYHYRLLACLNRFYKSPPPSFKYDLYSLIMDGIQYKCFTLDNTPSLQAIRSMSIFYAILCRITKQKEKLKVFCMDAIYCLSFKASPTIFNILKLWPQILPKAKSFAGLYFIFH